MGDTKSNRRSFDSLDSCVCPQTLVAQDDSCVWGDARIGMTRAFGFENRISRKAKGPSDERMALEYWNEDRRGSVLWNRAIRNNDIAVRASRCTVCDSRDELRAGYLKEAMALASSS